jgi:hypothetical protein
MVADEAGHQRRAEGADLAARIVERKRGNIELAVDHRVPLFLWLEQRGTGKDLDVEPDIGGFRLARDDLQHLIAGIALAAGELMRRAQGNLRVGRKRQQGGHRQRNQHTPMLPHDVFSHKVQDYSACLHGRAMERRCQRQPESGNPFDYQ